MRINELGKKVSDWEVKLKQQQQLYESVRSDRNLYSKNLIEAQDEIAEMKRKLKIMNHQIEQLKEDITAKVLAGPSWTKHVFDTWTRRLLLGSSLCLSDVPRYGNTRMQRAACISCACYGDSDGTKCSHCGIC